VKHNASAFFMNKERNKPGKQEGDVDSQLRQWVQKTTENTVACGSRNDVSCYGFSSAQFEFRSVGERFSVARYIIGAGINEANEV
jgi:glutamine synthetase type III